jgi:hypothetical protein
MGQRIIAGYISLSFLFLAGCSQVEVPEAPITLNSPSQGLVSKIESTSIGDFLESKDGSLCQVRYIFKKDRELNCGDGVPLWGAPEHHARLFVRVIKKGDPEYKKQLARFPVQYK